MRVVDSHTAGEPTRVIIDGGPQLGAGSVAAKARILRQDYNEFCASVLLEPRGHDALVGALLVPPSDPGCVTGVIYFNPAGPLGMCGHATIGVAVTLAHLGRISAGQHRFETPVGVVEVTLHDSHRATVVNVESYRLHQGVTVNLDGLGVISGDVAWGGNWFFLSADAPLPLEPANVTPLSLAARQIRRALADAGITGADGACIDHIEFTAPPRSGAHHSRNFVLCPGGAYDRSPCGTGSAAKLACLAADGDLAPGEVWVQESIINSSYHLSYQPGAKGGVIATITGEGFVTAQSELLFAPQDPYARGICPQSFTGVSHGL